jgi:hypothetical protein
MQHAEMLGDSGADLDGRDGVGVEGEVRNLARKASSPLVRWGTLRVMLDVMGESPG